MTITGRGLSIKIIYSVHAALSMFFVVIYLKITLSQAGDIWCQLVKLHWSSDGATESWKKVCV